MSGAGGGRVPKLFVGQVPKAFSDAELRAVFAPFGNIVDIMIIRNRGTGESKGCAFVTFSSAHESDAALNGLHNNKVLPGANNALQVKYADEDQPGHGQGPSDAVAKLFVGKLPPSVTEDELRRAFEPFGRVLEVILLRERDGSCKGCGFVKLPSRAEGDAAIASLNGKLKLDGSSSEAVVKYADVKRVDDRSSYGSSMPVRNPVMSVLSQLIPGIVGAPGEEVKLFISKLPPEVSEQDIRRAFDPYGRVLEVILLRENDGRCKGCGFVKYLTRYEADAAIQALHGRYRIEGGPAPMVVKYADSQREKDERRGAPSMSPPSSMPMYPPAYGYGDVNAYQLQAAAAYMSPYAPPMMPMIGDQSGSASSSSPYAGTYAGSASSVYPASAGYNYGYYHGRATAPSGATTTYASPVGATPSPYAGVATPSSGVTPPYPSTTSAPPALTSSYAGTASPTRAMPPVVASRTAEGPPGSNLFIYHLPSEFTDNDLGSMFSPFGNLLSASVFVDKDTGRSKGFGFVSFDSPDAAQTAIDAMNGYQVGQNRLRVQLKQQRASSAARPY
eukprot:TRINITY_DN2295_c0_g2_i1.p1 TRINITY_DN2295_c0_g2~~TRINITY_DN2295_c0_g2_i1.p1  ORF type:complete len:559 (-),score=90.03 TRINITY_DN2295_c0_g2_i1:87-1763(-)